MSTVYDTQPWRDFRSRVRDADCALAHLVGGCEGPLHVHHVQPMAEGGPVFPTEDGVATLCARHHALVHSWRKRQEPRWKRCPHHHRTAESRRLCEERLNAAA